MLVLSFNVRPMLLISPCTVCDDDRNGVLSFYVRPMLWISPLNEMECISSAFSSKHELIRVFAYLVFDVELANQASPERKEKKAPRTRR